ncbi:MAG: NADH-quinone oxidoreductase subunit K [Deltaproteobacteria bacterium]|nr:NADH-quinone oxidoreductase subunit K [Deltaproteobacteria bacterium]
MTVFFYAVAALALFAVGLVAILLRRNALYVVVGVSLQAAATGVLFAAFATAFHKVDGTAMAMIVMVLGGLHAVVGFAAFTGLHKQHSTPSLDDSRLLKG